MYAHGHVNAPRYTPAQVRLYVDAIWREERFQKRQRIVEMRIAAADQKSFENTMRKLAAPLPDSDD